MIEAESKLKVLEILNSECPAKYPKGSCVVFGDPTNEFIGTGLVSCVWYNKIGGENPSKNIQWNPENWKNITQEKAVLVMKTFDTAVMLPLTGVECNNEDDSEPKLIYIDENNREDN
jgi:hypothetical protein